MDILCPPPLEVILDEITCLWLTGYVDYKNQFLAASLNVEITQLKVLYIYVIAWLGVKFGINFTSVVVRMAEIARGEAEPCYDRLIL